MVKFWPFGKGGTAPVSQEQHDDTAVSITSLCAACRNIVFHPMRSMTPDRWSEYFPFLVDRPDLADEYSKRHTNFLQQLPADDTYEAILQLDYASLESNAEPGTCSFCHFLLQLLQGCYRSEPSVPGTSPYEGIVTYPRVEPPEEDVDELRSCSPVVWLEASVKEHGTNGLSLEDALEDAVIVLKMANTLVYPRFLVNDVQRREQTTEEQHSEQQKTILDSHTGSKPNLELAKNWLSTCRTQHPQCRQQDDEHKGLPSRLLDLRIPGWKDDIILRMTSDLVNSDGETGGANQYAYASLSHRWGEHQPVKTTTANIERHLTRIQFAELPKTFQEAIDFTRELGIRYLWIDCLCVLQDSTVDKEQEIPKMVEIYNNAVFNIAACAAQDSSAGLFSTRETENVHPQRLPLTFRTEDGSNHKVMATLSPMIKNVSQSSGKIDNVLEERGWIFQERAFSKRVFSFETKLLWFECRQMIASENLSQGAQRNAGDSDARQKWDDLLPEVGNRDLSDLSDHLFHALELKDKKGKYSKIQLGDTLLTTIRRAVQRARRSALPWLVRRSSNLPLPDF
jgi:Heterokaryon incompatibility protein (HET)